MPTRVELVLLSKSTGSMQCTHEDVVSLSVVVGEEESAQRRHVRLVFCPSRLHKSFIGVDGRRGIVQWPCEPPHDTVVDVEDGVLHRSRSAFNAELGRGSDEGLHCRRGGMVQSRWEWKEILMPRKR